ncbi:MAG: 50S ribosomal protein L25 [Myxococcota bacterium]
MDTTLNVTARETSGKGWARKARAAGKLPGVVYGPKTDAKSVEFDPEILLGLFKTTGNRNTIVQVTVDGAATPCLVREVQRHPVSREILHVDFYAPDPEAEIEVMVPLAATGRPKGAILGGRLRIVRRRVKVACRYDRIPEQLTCDITPLDIGDMIMASEIPLPDGVRLVADNDFQVISVYGKKRGAQKKS